MSRPWSLQYIRNLARKRESFSTAMDDACNMLEWRVTEKSEPVINKPLDEGLLANKSVLQDKRKDEICSSMMQQEVDACSSGSGGRDSVQQACDPLLIPDIHTCYIVFMYRKPDPAIPTDQLIKFATGAEYTHVDCIFVPCKSMDIDTDLLPLPSYFTQVHTEKIRMNREMHVMRILFSSYLGENFTYYVPSEFGVRTNNTHSTMALEVQPDEMKSAWKYMMALAEQKVPYNASDLLMCCLPETISYRFLRDVAKHKMPKKVFCSQAMVLMLKHCMQPNRVNGALLADMQYMVSRATSPMELFKKLYAYCIELDTDSFVQESVLCMLWKQ